jgi:hypothetical protein
MLAHILARLKVFLMATKRQAVHPKWGESWSINLQIRPLHTSAEDETRLHGSDNP